MTISKSAEERNDLILVSRLSCAKLENSLLMLPWLEPRGVLIITSDLESFSCRKYFLDIQFLISVRQDIVHDASVVPGFIGTYNWVSST